MNYDKENYAVYVSLVESAPHNRVDKKYLGVGLHLFAIACKLSFEAKFDGYVHFVSKSSLIKHYVSKLNAKQIGGRKMLIETKEAKLLVQKYFKETC